MFEKHEHDISEKVQESPDNGTDTFFVGCCKRRIFVAITEDTHASEKAG